MSKKIKLSQGMSATVDDSDFDTLSIYRWSVARCGNSYYATRYKGRKTIYMHREIVNAPPDKQVDHKNHDGLDNRRSNLRICSRSDNQHNRIKDPRNTSGYKGVTFDKRRNRWVAQIFVNYRHKHIGSFETAMEAAIAYDNTARNLYGEFVVTNF